MMFVCDQVCNHPDLFERREVRSPFHMRIEPYILPKLVYREGTVCFCLYGSNWLNTLLQTYYFRPLLLPMFMIYSLS